MTLVVKAIPFRSEPETRGGACRECGRALCETFAAVRGRDAARDEEAIYTDSFCSRGCYHAYARAVTSPSATARWN